MMLTFLRVLEEQDNLGKRSDTRWKPEAWNECRDVVQQVYTGTGQITTDYVESLMFQHHNPTSIHYHLFLLSFSL